MRALLAAGLLLAALAVPTTARAADPYLTLDTPGPYHYGQTITVTAHGDIPKDKGNRPGARIFLTCLQNDWPVYSENLDSPIAETPYTFHLGHFGGSQWDQDGGGAADCEVRLTTLGRHQPGIVFTRILFPVEA